MSESARWLDLEYKYRVEGHDDLLPYTLARKATQFAGKCVLDGNPVPTSSWLCLECTESLRRNLDLIGRRWEDLVDALHPAGGSRRDGERSGSSGDGSALPICVEVSDAMREARSVIWSIVGQLMQDRPDLKLPADHGTGVLADWLARWHVDYLAAHPSEGHMNICFAQIRAVAYLTDQYASGAGAVARRPITEPCAQLTAGGSCPGQLEAVLLPDDRQIVECTADPGHAIPWDTWVLIQSRKATRRKRVVGHVARKYAYGRAPSVSQ